MKSLLLPPVFGRGLGLLMACELGCASTQSTEVSALRQEIAALRSSHDSDRKRIERLESEVDAQEIEMGKLRHTDGERGDLPPGGLPIVRLPSSPEPYPTRAQPPTLATNVQLKEPSAEDIAQLQANQLDVESSSDEADALFRKAFEKLKVGDLAGAATDFRGFVHRFPNHPSADNALLDEGLAFIGLRRCEDADRTFTEIERRYPAGDALPEALWRKAECETRLGQDEMATGTLRKLTRQFPNTFEGKRAIARLGDGSAAVAGGQR